MNFEQLLRTSEVARRLDISAARVQQLRVAGKLRAIRTALGFLFKSEEVDRLSRERQTSRTARGGQDS
jgi:excisionase family DNA binding protein